MHLDNRLTAGDRRRQLAPVLEKVAADLRPDEVAKRPGIPADTSLPKGLLRAYNERQKQMAAGAATGFVISTARASHAPW